MNSIHMGSSKVAALVSGNSDALFFVWHDKLTGGNPVQIQIKQAQMNGKFTKPSDVGTPGMGPYLEYSSSTHFGTISSTDGKFLGLYKYTRLQNGGNPTWYQYLDC